MSEEWVTDPNVIDTLVMLDGLQAGDEIKITGGVNYALGEYPDGAVLQLRDWGNAIGRKGEDPGFKGHVWGSEPAVARIARAGLWIVCRKNIVAWRRPQNPK